MSDSDCSDVSSSLDNLCKRIYIDDGNVMHESRKGDVTRLESLDDIPVYRFIKREDSALDQLYPAALRNTLTVFEELIGADVDLLGENSCAKHMLSPRPKTTLDAGQGLLYYPDDDESCNGKFVEQSQTSYGAICVHIFESSESSERVTLRKNKLYLLYGTGRYRSQQCDAYIFEEGALHGTVLADSVIVEPVRTHSVLRCMSTSRGKKIWRQTAKRRLYLCENCENGENAGEDGLLWCSIRGERPNCSIGSSQEYAERTGTSKFLLDTDKFVQQQCLAGKVLKVKSYYADLMERPCRRMAKALFLKEANTRALGRTSGPINVTYAELSSISGLGKAGVAFAIALDAEVGSKFCEDNLCYSPFARGEDRPFRLARSEDLPCELLRLLFGITEDGKTVCVKTGQHIKISVSDGNVIVERGVGYGVPEEITADITSMKVFGRTSPVEGRTE